MQSATEAILSTSSHQNNLIWLKTYFWQEIWNIPSCSRIDASTQTRNTKHESNIAHCWKWSAVKLLTQKIRISPHRSNACLWILSWHVTELFRALHMKYSNIKQMNETTIWSLFRSEMTQTTPGLYQLNSYSVIKPTLLQFRPTDKIDLYWSDRSVFILAHWLYKCK